MENNNNNVPSGIGAGFFAFLFAVFTIFKLCAVINWSWLWVLAPLWLPLSYAIFVVILSLIFKRKLPE